LDQHQDVTNLASFVEEYGGAETKSNTMSRFSNATTLLKQSTAGAMGKVFMLQ